MRVKNLFAIHVIDPGIFAGSGSTRIANKNGTPSNHIFTKY